MSVADTVSRLSTLRISHSAPVKHGAATSPATWKDALANSDSVPQSYQLIKTLVFKPKTAKNATPIPVIVIASEDTETSSATLSKKLNLKDLRLAPEDLLTSFFGIDKDALSPLSLTQELFPKVLTVLDASLASSTVIFAVHPSVSDSTIFLQGKDIAAYLRSLETPDVKIHEIDFIALKAESSVAPAAPIKKPEPKAEKVDARIEGAKQIAIGIKKEVDFAGWYTNVLIKADMIDYYSVSGCYILKPWSFTIWEAIQEWFNARIKEMDVENAYFPMFVSQKVLEREKDHIAGFAPEVAWVTRAGSSELEEPVAIRPTSETVMYPYYAKWIQSYRDLPLKLNQWNSVVRWEFKNPQPFLRTREFLWQEGHTAHARKEEADVEVRQILDLYRRVYEELLAVPVIPGDSILTTVEGFIPTSGRGIQGATSHCLGQNFSKMFNIVVEDPEKPGGSEDSKLFVWQNSWGLSTRTIGVMVMVHGDNQGLVLPPRVASIQVVIIPCGLTVKLAQDERKAVLDACQDAATVLKGIGVRAKADLRDVYTPGWKFADWEQKGVPLRLEIGPADLKRKQTVSVRRDNGVKANIALSDLTVAIPSLLQTIQSDMYIRANDVFQSRLKTVTEWDDLVPTLDAKCVAVIPWCEVESCEDDIKERSGRSPSAGAKSLAIPFDQERWGPLKEGTRCPACQRPSKRWTMFGRSY
ncbi:hypothetical protein BS47DRAFT_1375516 [Hydnum rufescens UP504]|uniref:proline--tRNA ligase n=1 Tax=Hydnum rufescens UP504 TaxID=1448309 RepID=A0A9P6DXT3_9AGAM|nr:hypothetical protein BS47DRAFT_1375516 [Hydnum rufescens UP504]